VTLLKVEELDCRYGLLQAVRGVSFEVAQGEIVALIGPTARARPRCCEPSPARIGRTRGK